jgi:hypothetical protein
MEAKAVGDFDHLALGDPDLRPGPVVRGVAERHDGVQSIIAAGQLNDDEDAVSPVTTEGELVETTIAHLNSDTSLSRNDIKTAFASLTIGSGSAAIVLCHRELSRTGNRLLGGAFRAESSSHELCAGGVADLGVVAGGGEAGGRGTSSRPETTPSPELSRRPRR